MEVTELVNRHNTANPFIIAEYENIDVKFVSLPSDLKGLMLSTPNDKPMIWINDNIRDCNLKYLVMAHELKHALDHYGLDGFYTAANAVAVYAYNLKIGYIPSCDARKVRRMIHPIVSLRLYYYNEKYRAEVTIEYNGLKKEKK